MRLKQEWLIALLLAALAGLSMLTLALNPANRPGEAYSDRSIYNSQPSGYKAWHLVAEKSGLTVTPWKKPFHQLDTLPQPATMLAIEPLTFSARTVTFSPESVARLLHWVKQGNTVILLDDFKRRGTALMPQAVGLSAPRPSQEGMKHYRLTLSEPAEAAGLGYRLRQGLITSSDKRFFIPPNPRYPTRPLLVDENHRPAVIEVDYHGGRLILGTVSDVASNALLQSESDNYQGFTNLAARGGFPVFVNEFVHGHNEISDIFAYYRANTPLETMLAQLVFAFGFVIWLSMVPWRPRQGMKKDSADMGVGITPYIRSLAGLYWRQQASALALQPQLERIETLLRNRYRLSLHEEGGRLQSLLATLAGDYSSKDESPARWAESLKRAMQVVDAQQRIEHRELLRHARHLMSLEERLKQGHPHVFTG